MFFLLPLIVTGNKKFKTNIFVYVVEFFYLVIELTVFYPILVLDLVAGNKNASISRIIHKPL